MSQPESARVSLTRRTLTWRRGARQKPRSLSGQTGTARQSPYPYADDDGGSGGHRSGKPTHGTAPRAACRAHRARMDRWRLRSARRRKNAPSRPKTLDRLHERRRPTRPELTAPEPYAGEAQPDHVMRKRISAPPNHPRTRPVETQHTFHQVPVDVACCCRSVQAGRSMAANGTDRSGRAAAAWTSRPSQRAGPSQLIPAPLLFDSHAPQAVTAVGHTQV